MLTSNQKQSILQVRFDLIAYHTVMETIERWRQAREQHYVTITNPHSVMMCSRDAEMHKATEMASLTLPDGVGIILAASLLHYQHNGRATGPMLMLKLCDWGRQKGYRHFFYGGAEGVVEKLAARLSNMYSGLQVAGTYTPPFKPLSYQEDQAVIKKINSTEPDIVWIGLGAPKQEKWMAEHLGRIKAAAMIGVGAAFDFHSGNVKWAPEWIRKSGLEWAYRLIQEPKRMFRRNLDSPLFLAKVVQQFVSDNLHSKDRTISSQP
ncbi:MAG: WecB/TagA/CpsF family glycosyltransferase [Bacteroidales bacterium]|nr:WecB/TagA/CpsF family glycosyltransferase [Bacteroidales bacterium]